MNTIFVLSIYLFPMKELKVVFYFNVFTLKFDVLE